MEPFQALLLLPPPTHREGPGPFSSAPRRLAAMTEFGRPALCSHKWEKTELFVLTFVSRLTLMDMLMVSINQIKMAGSLFKSCLDALVLLL